MSRLYLDSGVADYGRSMSSGLRSRLFAVAIVANGLIGMLLAAASVGYMVQSRIAPAVVGGVAAVGFLGLSFVNFKRRRDRRSSEPQGAWTEDDAVALRKRFALVVIVILCIQVGGVIGLATAYARTAQAAALVVAVVVALLAGFTAWSLWIGMRRTPTELVRRLRENGPPAPRGR